jgi:predicted Zn-dependent protease
LLLAGALTLAAVPSRAQDTAAGDEARELTEEFGGAYNNAALTSYVTEIGEKLVPTTSMAGKKFTFTVLDSPVVNAFSLPGGYVFVTRGLLALANNEAEMAGVLGHEIGHVTAGHAARRLRRTALAELGAGLLQLLVGKLGNAEIGKVMGDAASFGGLYYIRRYSREQEFQADQLGTISLAKAGYDPGAMGTFLGSLEAESEFENMEAGRPADDRLHTMFADHPRTPDRVERAVDEARKLQQSALLNRDAYLHHLDGVLFDDDPEQGVLRDGEFVHPNLRLAFSVPEGYEVDNEPSKVVVQNDEHAGFIFDRPDAAFAGAPEEYIAKVWAPNAKSEVQRLTIGDLAAATVTTEAKNDDGTLINVRLVAVRYDNDTIYRFLFVMPTASGSRFIQTFQRVMYSFRRLSEEDAAKVKPLVVRLVTVAAGDTVESLAARLPYVRYKIERFRTMNGLSADAMVKVGDTVKIVTWGP